LISFLLWAPLLLLLNT
jgi:hypothetical protein